MKLTPENEFRFRSADRFYCANCAHMTTLDMHSRCFECQSENVSANPPERRDMSEAGRLRRASFRFRDQGQPIMAQLLLNDALRLEEREKA